MSSMSSMSSLIDLSKKVSIVLEKRNAINIKAQVGFVFDGSISMRKWYKGIMQEITNRVQAIAVKFDDNQTLDAWMFTTEAFELKPATPGMFGKYVDEYVLPNKGMWGGTNFSPVLRMVRDHYFGGNIASGFLKSIVGSVGKDPVYLIFETDGDNGDEEATEEILESLASKRIYIQFVGVGTDTTFEFIQRMAEKYPHVGFVDLSNPTSVSDEQMYEKLLCEEFITWMKG